MTLPLPSYRTYEQLLDDFGGPQPEQLKLRDFIHSVLNRDSSLIATREEALTRSIPSEISFVRTAGYSTVGSGGALYKKVNSLPSHAGWFQSADGAIWEIAEPIINVRMLGAVGNGVSSDQTAIVNALGIGRPVFFPNDGTFTHTSVFTLPDGIEIFGVEGSILQNLTPDVTSFFGDNISNIYIHDLTILGGDDATGSSIYAAVSLRRCTDFYIHDLILENWLDRGIYVTGIAASDEVCQGGIIERVTMRDGQSPARFSGSAVYIGEHTEDITVQDCTFDGMNAGVIVQNVQTTVHPHLKTYHILNNHITNCLQYGIVLYKAGPSISITGAVDNGAGLIRLTATDHLLEDGDPVQVASVGGTVEANGLWTATVIDDDTIDLQGSAFANAYTSGGTLIHAAPLDAVIQGNVVEDIDGTPTSQNSNNGAFGAGFYAVSCGGFTVQSNVFRRTNLGTTTITLAPGGIGIAGCYGEVLVEGNLVEDCGIYGIYVVDATGPNNDVNIIGNSVRSCARDGIRVVDATKFNVSNNVVRGKKATTLSAGIQVTNFSNTPRGVVNSNVVIIHGPTRPFSIQHVTDLVCSGNYVMNEAPAATLCELAYFSALTNATIQGNIFDGGLAEYIALQIVDVTDSTITGNISKMTDSVAARACVSMSGTCTGTLYDRSNRHSLDRMQNTSTGGVMHTYSTNNLSGGKTRADQDVIWTTAVAVGSTVGWVNIGGSTWYRFGEVESQQTIATDAVFTLTPGSSPIHTLHTGVLTADRAVTLSTTGAWKGLTFRVTRTGGGAFNLNVGTGPLKALATNTWGEFTYDGSAYYLSRYGAL